MKQLLTILFVFLALLSFGQQNQPSGTLSLIASPAQYYRALDSTLHEWKGTLYKWNRLLTSKDSAKLVLTIGLKQDKLNGTGFVKSSSGTISYDNSDYFKYQTFTADANTLAAGSAFTYGVNAPWWGPLVNFDANNFGLELNSNYLTARTLAFRTHNGDANTWNNWIHLFGFRDDLPAISGYLPRTSSDYYFVNSQIYDNGNIIVGTNWINHSAAKLNVPYDMWVGEYNSWVNFSLEGQVNLKILNNTHGIIKPNWVDGTRGGITMQYCGDLAGTMADGLVLDYLGKVGVGTISPYTKLDVIGDVGASFGSDATRVVGIGLDGSFTSGKTGVFRFADSWNQLETSFGGTMKGKSYHGWQFYNQIGEVARFGTSSGSLDSYFKGSLDVANNYSKSGVNLFLDFLRTGYAGTTGQFLISNGISAAPSWQAMPLLNQSTTGSAATLTTARTIAGTSFNGSANIALSNKFIVQGTSDAGLSGAQFLGALGNGILKNTTTTGALTIATGADLPVMTASVGGAVPTPPNNTTTFLRGDGTFAAPTSALSGGTTNRLTYWTSSSAIGNAPFSVSGTDILNLSTIKGGTSTGGNFWVGGGGVSANGAGSTGSFNIAIGASAGLGVTSGYYNALLGHNAGWSINSGYYNTCIGGAAGTGITTGFGITAIGLSSLPGVTTSNSTVGVGWSAGYQTVGASANPEINQGVFIGASTRPSASGNSNETVIGYNANGAGSNTVTIGNTSVTTTYLQGSVNASGGIDLPYVAKTTAYTITSNDYVVDCTSGTFTVTLPTAVGIAGKIYIIKRSGTGVITVGTTSSQTIDGATNPTLATQYLKMTVMSNGTNWITI